MVTQCHWGGLTDSIHLPVTEDNCNKDELWTYKARLDNQNLIIFNWLSSIFINYFAKK